MRPKLLLIAIAACAVASLPAIRLRATPASIGFQGMTVAKATFEELGINLHTIPADDWQMRLKTQGFTDIYVQKNTWAPLSTTGWHTHPGPSLIVITAGTVVAYDSDDPTCSPTVYTADSGGVNHFVDAGGGHVHLVRNEDSSITATGYAVQFVPEAATRRIDADQPASCPASVH
jgi:hypothetical protein